MKCLRCGTESTENLGFCKVCGGKLEETQEVNSVNQQPVVNNAGVQQSTIVIPEPITEQQPVQPTVEPVIETQHAVIPTPVVEPTSVVEPVINETPVVPSVQEPVQPVNTQIPVNNTNTPKKGNSALPIIVVLVIILGGIGFWYFNNNGKEKKNYSNNNSSVNGNTNTNVPSNNNNSNNNSSSKNEKPCNIERDHIHLSDLSNDELKKLNISFSLGMVRTYTNSDIKAIVFNGKEYDYKEVLGYLTDFNGMTNFVSANTKFLEFGSYDSGEWKYEIKGDLTPDRVGYYSSYVRKNHAGHGYVSQRYYVLGADEPVPTERKSSNTTRYIEVSLLYDRDNLIVHDANSYNISVDDYGKYHGDNDYIKFSVDGLDMYRGINEDFGFILNDGRYVHMLRDIDSLDRKEWNITKNIYVTHAEVKWKDE